MITEYDSSIFKGIASNNNFDESNQNMENDALRNSNEEFSNSVQ
jgi:hypothetical protein